MEHNVSFLVNRAVSLVSLVLLCHCDNIVGRNFLCWNVLGARGVPVPVSSIKSNAGMLISCQ